MTIRVCSFYFFLAYIVKAGNTQGGNHMRLASIIVQGEKESEKDDWPFLWSRLAEFFVFKTGDNGLLSNDQMNMLRALGTMSNRVADTHKGIRVSDLLQQYRRAYLEVKAKHPRIPKPPGAEVKRAFSVINTKGQERYAGVIKPLAKTNNEELWNLVEELFAADGEVKDSNRISAKSTAPFNGMSARWNHHCIPDSRKLEVLRSFQGGSIMVSKMVKIWQSELNKVLFIHYVNTVLRTNFTPGQFSEAIALIPPSSQRAVLDLVTTGPKLKPKSKQVLKMPDLIQKAVLEARKLQEKQLVSN
jgi:hypothetical protein